MIRADRVHRAWAAQRRARERTRLQIAYIDRRLLALSSPEDDDLIARLNAERAVLAARWR